MCRRFLVHTCIAAPKRSVQYSRNFCPIAFFCPETGKIHPHTHTICGYFFALKSNLDIHTRTDELGAWELPKVDKNSVLRNTCDEFPASFNSFWSKTRQVFRCQISHFSELRKDLNGRKRFHDKRDTKTLHFHTNPLTSGVVTICGENNGNYTFNSIILTLGFPRKKQLPKKHLLFRNPNA